MPSRTAGGQSSARLTLAAAMTALLAGGLTACSHSPGQNFGTVSGIAEPCAGVFGLGQAQVTVYASHDGRTVKTERVVIRQPHGSRYRLTLRAAVYVISAPAAYLPAQTVSVRAGGTTTVNFRPSCK